MTIQEMMSIPNLLEYDIKYSPQTTKYEIEFTYGHGRGIEIKYVYTFDERMKYTEPILQKFVESRLFHKKFDISYLGQKTTESEKNNDFFYSWQDVLDYLNGTINNKPKPPEIVKIKC